MAPTAAVSTTANITSASYCTSLCSALKLSTEYATQAVSCDAIPANQEFTFTGGQATAQCGSTSTSSFTPTVDICRVTLSITTSGESETYMEVWLPNNSTTAWNGRTLSTDNGGANGCVHYVDMQYVTSLGFAAIGDNGGHNSSAFDAGWMYFQNEVILDWVYRARHASVAAGKQVIQQFYDKKPTYSYYLGCSTGGQQGLHSAQYYPDDFDGIIAGSAAADFNHLQAWSGRFVQLTGTNSSDARFLTEDQWILVQSYIFDQCDEALDGVNDGILEDPTICQFDSSVIPVCNATTTSDCLTSTQINTVNQVFTELYNENGELLYPALLYGSQVDAFRLGQLSGSVQAISSKWYGGGVYNNSYYDAMNMNQTDYAKADSEDALHGNVSSFNGDLSAFKSAGKKLLMYHGMADPLVSGGNSQRYYLKVAKTLGLDNTGLDPFFRYFRISGMAHCGVGGISGAGAWMFGQSGAAAVAGVSDNIVWNMVDWVEKGDAPDTILGTKFWYDTPSLGLDFQRPHCRFPYRTTYSGNGSWEDPANWGCEFISDWQQCEVGAHPRLCNADGTFTP
jgi:feruloyl esterase